MNFGEKLCQLRKERGISQRDLATLIERDFTYISKIEVGHSAPPSEEVIRHIAQVLDANELELLSLAGKVPPGLKAALKASPALTTLIHVLTEHPQTDEVYSHMIAIVTGKVSA